MEVGEVSSQAVSETCVVCGEIKTKGIHLYTSFICMECEMDMIKTETNDPKYPYYLKQLRKVTAPSIYS
ncbi:sigma factor G inhibitor Gin [Bacillus sp. FJAT-27225]|uniref:sigma factor G inhibitor Gin n=1 Tax=Bacillus sp. FJAT-27225 TaxID=1743144 RepID=UPI00080C2121|nr:sigma factor G inhibitor Gin [Bacillus sp. FJAT-27225]OCA80653.1 sigma factor G inhibitor Gin [Bacillus sp. FJAT-27225]